MEPIEKSKRVQWDQQAEYRELFRHSQIWERQAAIACRGRSGCFIPNHSIPAGAHKRTKNRNWGRKPFPGTLWRVPADWPCGVRCTGGVTLIRAWVRNLGTRHAMRRENLTSAKHEGGKYRWA